MRAAAALAAAVALAPAANGTAAASSRQDSLFMDDPALVYGSPERVESTLAALQALGVDRVRVSLYWRLVAPSPGSKERPAFDARDPAAYPPGAWERYDRLVEAAGRRGMRLLMSVTGPSPLWATGRPERRTIEETYAPDADAFGEFVEAAGRRWPDVDSWSVWNEPNHPGWLTPQWIANRSGSFAAAPILYRALLDSAWEGLVASGHGGDEVLIGELAPRGWDRRGLIQAMRPLEFVRELYCVNRSLRPYRGDQARARLCPPDGRGFAAEHPALFRAAGFAHHPYAFDRAPGVDDDQPDNVPLAGLHRLTRTLDAATRVHGAPRRLPIHLTEYGYQTRPDPAGIRQATHAAWLAEAEYLAYRNPRVSTTAQFLLRDDAPLPGFPPSSPRRWGSFQTGLLTYGGRAKRALLSYARPLHVFPRRVRPGGAVRVFARLRAGRAPTLARIEVRPQRGRSFGVVREMTTDGHGFVNARVRMRQAGSLRVSFLPPGDGRPLRTRTVSVAVGG